MNLKPLKMSNREAYVITEEKIMTYFSHFQQKIYHKAFETTQILVHGSIRENACFTVNQLLIEKVNKVSQFHP